MVIYYDNGFRRTQKFDSICNGSRNTYINSVYAIPLQNVRFLMRNFDVMLMYILSLQKSIHKSLTFICKTLRMKEIRLLG